jgi:hypothetical protein
MSLTTRLERATQSLTPLQRAVLVLQALRDGREVGSDITDSKDEQQRRAFNRYMALLWVANHQLGANAAIIAFRVELAQKEHWRVQVLNQAAGLLDEDEGRPPSKAQRNWRKRKGPIEVPVFLRSLALECDDDCAELVQHLWREVLALEQVWQDLSAEFGGEDPVLPEHRERLKQTTEELRELAGDMGIKKLPEQPDDELTQAWANVVNESFRHLGLVEPYV